jgi:hypothetical protein
MNTHTFNERCGVPMEVLFERTGQKVQYLEEQGFKVVQMWECEYRELRKTKELQAFLATYEQQLDVRTRLTFPELLNEIESGNIFGVVECDIRVPDHKKEKFAEMCPIFKNTDIPFDAIGEHMQNFVRENKLSEKPRRGLIGSMFAEKILLITPLLQWYIKQGLEVTNIYEVTEFIPKACFDGFADQVSEARREGDAIRLLKL